MDGRWWRFDGLCVGVGQHCKDARRSFRFRAQGQGVAAATRRGFARSGLLAQVDHGGPWWILNPRSIQFKTRQEHIEAERKRRRRRKAAAAKRSARSNPRERRA